MTAVHYHNIPERTTFHKMCHHLIHYCIIETLTLLREEAKTLAECESRKAQTDERTGGRGKWCEMKGRGKSGARVSFPHAYYMMNNGAESVEFPRMAD